MSTKHTRFTLMAFPQSVDATGKLLLHILFVPRNINPLNELNTIYAAGGKATPFADAQPQFSAVVVNNADEFAGKVPANERPVSITVPYPSQARQLYTALKDAKKGDGTPKYFDIDENRSSDVPGSELHRAPEAEEHSKSVKKYLPVSYQKAFNFTGPRNPNAVTDDSYHCAVRDQTPPIALKKDDKISWGKVYAHLLRQPLMAEKAGLLYKTTVQLEANDFQNGGWLYVDVRAGVYSAEQQASLSAATGLLINRYAAKIPALKKDANGAFETTPLFAAVLFPVLKEGDNPDGIYDDIFIETAQYQNGFARIVHASQPVSANLLKEERDGFHPQKEMGIRLGWEDEQILTWYLRQMAKDENVSGGGRLDAPLGVGGFHVDVRPEGTADWESLTAVQSNGAMQLEGIDLGAFDGELPFQVYPVKLYGVNTSNYWLPMYFSNWNDHSLVLPDKKAAEIYQNDKALQTVNDTVENRNVTLSDTYTAKTNTVKLRYGGKYQFRVRLTDITGGGPLPGNPMKEKPENVAKQAFKRYVAPYGLRIVQDVNAANQIKHSTDDVNFSGEKMVVKRPLLSYPAVVYTGKYTEDEAVTLLKNSIAEKIASYTTPNPKDAIVGIADPDVKKVAIKVEVETLQMDNLASDSGKENFITLYNTFRNFAGAAFDELLELGFAWKDYPVLNFTDDKLSPFRDAGDNATIIAIDGPLVIPTGRNVRLTIRAVCEGDDNYWGTLDDNPDYDSRWGKTTILKLRRESTNETALLAEPSGLLLQGIFLQPDPIPVFNSFLPKSFIPAGKGIPDIVQRLAKQIDVADNGLTLNAEKGERLQFWCSNMLRHTLSPDNSSITFANKNELINHWLVVTTLTLNRDWTWDELKPSAFLVERRKSFSQNPARDKAEDAKPDGDRLKGVDWQLIGDMEIRKTASFQAIQEGEDGKIHREYTRLVFIDVVDGLPAGNDKPDTILSQYRITPQFRSGVAEPTDAVFATEFLELPAVVNPTQIPKVIGAGMALSPYIRNDKYSATEARKRFLWLEFDKKPDDGNDDLFARALAYAPDQLLSNNAPELFAVPEEPPLPIDPEYIRVVTPHSGRTHAGLKAMQKMEKSVDDGRHFYLLPLPEGLHAESAELFGFFTYEFRFGHSDRLWSTAQARFGRAFRLTGLQHPAPTMTCTITRDEKDLLVNAPFARAVMNGKNVTSAPPRTSIWALLYAQVVQADGQGYRNILIDQQKLTIPKVVRSSTGLAAQETMPEHVDFASFFLTDTKVSLTLEQQQQRTLLAQKIALRREATLYAQVTWTNAEINQLLEMYGLPVDSSLSVVCVEVFGTITKLSEHVNDIQRKGQDLADSISLNLDQGVGEDLRKYLPKVQPSVPDDTHLPLTDELGQHRILRTSPLTEVPFVCCTE